MAGIVKRSESMVGNLSSFHFMPEIEDEIFECAARMSLSFAPTLSLISKRIQMRVERIIYETVILSAFHTFYNNTSYFEQFLYTLRSRPAEFFRRNVVNLCITATVPKSTTSEILSKCEGVRNLALWHCPDLPIFDPTTLIMPLSSTLCSINTDRSTLTLLAELGAVFPHVQKLSVGAWHKELTAFPGLEWLPRLKTVELGFWTQPYYNEKWKNDVRIVLSTTPLLQTLQLEVNDLALPKVVDGVRGLDARIVVVDYYDVKSWEFWL